MCCVGNVTHTSLREDDCPCGLPHTSITRHFLPKPPCLGHGQEHGQVPHASLCPAHTEPVPEPVPATVSSSQKLEREREDLEGDSEDPTLYWVRAGPRGQA